MNRRYIEQSPENVIWRNLNLNPYEQSVRQAISYAISVGLIIAWTFPGESIIDRSSRYLTLSQSRLSVPCQVSTPLRTRTAGWRGCDSSRAMDLARRS